jgi:hypothetical protein
VVYTNRIIGAALNIVLVIHLAATEQVSQNVSGMQTHIVRVFLVLDSKNLDKELENGTLH